MTASELIYGDKNTKDIVALRHDISVNRNDIAQLNTTSVSLSEVSNELRDRLQALSDNTLGNADRTVHANNIALGLKQNELNATHIFIYDKAKNFTARNVEDVLAEIAAGYVDGSGTAGYIPKWSDADTLANSIVSESGAIITVAGSLTVNTIAALGIAATTFLTHTTGLVQSRTAVQVLSDIGAAASGHSHDHATLTNLNSASYTHLTATNHTDLTDSGATTLHKHDHGGMDGLTDDDHTGYFRLAGRSGGQVAYGGTASGNDLTLESTSNATKGDVLIQPNGGSVGIGVAVPLAELHTHRDAWAENTCYNRISVTKGIYTYATAWGINAKEEGTPPNPIEVRMSNYIASDAARTTFWLLPASAVPYKCFSIHSNRRLASGIDVPDWNLHLGPYLIEADGTKTLQNVSTVIGLSSSDGTYVYTAKIDQTNQNLFQIGTTGTGGTSGGAMALYTNNIHRVYITGGGDVGIGVTPTGRLDVYSNSNSQSTTYIRNSNVGLSASAMLEVSSDLAACAIISYSSIRTGLLTGISVAGMTLLNSDNGTCLLIRQADNVPIYFATNDIVRATITGGGFFGVGETPGVKFSVLDPGNAGAGSTAIISNFHTTAASGHGACIKISDGASYGRIIVDNATARMLLAAGNSDANSDPWSTAKWLEISASYISANGLPVKLNTIKSGATQAAAAAAANELWKTSGHATLPNNVVMIGV